MLQQIFDHDQLHVLDRDGPKYELIALAFQRAILAARLRPGDRLPTVRNLSRALGVSGATVAAAYELLNNRGWVRGEVGRGTFVIGPPDVGGLEPVARPASAPLGVVSRNAPWRRRALIASAVRLRASYPNAIDCTTGRGDAALLPLQVLRRAWWAAVEETTADDLQYGGPQPVAQLVEALLPRLAADDIAVRAEDIIVGSSAQQLMSLAVSTVAGLRGAHSLTIAVEEPGYQTAFDALERAGHRLIGVSVDAYGAAPDSLDAALTAGASAVLFTPRAHNPTGVSWTVKRRAELADVVAAHPGVVAIEDDHFAGLALAPVASLASDPRIDDRVVYIRSFAKSIAPDLRIAVAVVHAGLRVPLLEEKSFTDGWTSRLTQRVLAKALEDDAMDEALAKAAATYATRRTGVLRELTQRLRPLGGTAIGADGVNIWIHLPASVDAAEVIERAAQHGVLTAPGEHFFVRPGRSDVVRLSIGAMSVEQAASIGQAFAAAASTASIVASAMSV